LQTTLHPTYGPALVRCACGNSFETRSTRAELRTEVCSACHPFYTGQPRSLAADSRIERFSRRWRTAAPAGA
jgi:large subunit ribosomal protein L31